MSLSLASSPVFWARAAAATAFVAVCGSMSGCFSTDNGPEPVQNEIYFPTGLLASPGGHALFVVNSDFDLQYKAGTVQALDLTRLRGLVPRLWAVTAPGDVPRPDDLPDAAAACAELGLSTQPIASAILNPGSCTAVDLNAPPAGLEHQQSPRAKMSLVESSVSIGAFAADATIAVRPDDLACCADVSAGVPCPCGQARLMIPVRGDPSLTWVEIEDDRPGRGTDYFKLQCNQSSDSGHCADDHRAGINADENARGVTMPSEPFTIAVADDQSVAVVTHQTTGTVSLFTNSWTVPPTLTFVLAGLSTGVTGSLAFPKPQLSIEHPEYSYQPGFLLSFRTSAEVDVIRYYDDAAAAPSRPFLARTAAIGIATNANGFDSRAIAIDTRARRTAEGACAPATGPDDPDRISCLASAAATPVAAFAANRIPPTLLVGQTTTNAGAYGTDDAVYFYDAVPLSQGPSRVYVADVWDGRAGVKRTRVFVVCFDARTIYVYDPDARAMEGVIQTGRGPSVLAFDPLLGQDVDPRPDGTAASINANYAYVGHFTDSYLGVLDLDMSHSTYLSIVGSVAIPQAPRESK